MRDATEEGLKARDEEVEEAWELGRGGLAAWRGKTKGQRWL